MAKVDITEFTKKTDALLDAYGRFPTEISTIAVNFSKDRFREQAWLDKTKESWKPLKRRRRGGRKKSQTVLVDTGRLKRSIRKIAADHNQIRIGTDVPYAEIHNNGGTINKKVTVKEHIVRSHVRIRRGRKEIVKEHKVGAHQRQMNTKIPARRFLGNSYTLERRITLHVTAQFMRALKK